MRKRRHTKLVHEGQYVAEVEVELTEMDEGWSPYSSLEDAYKLDDVRTALRRGDLKTAARLVSPCIQPDSGEPVMLRPSTVGRTDLPMSDFSPLEIHLRRNIRRSLPPMASAASFSSSIRSARQPR